MQLRSNLSDNYFAASSELMNAANMSVIKLLQTLFQSPQISCNRIFRVYFLIIISNRVAVSVSCEQTTLAKFFSPIGDRFFYIIGEFNL